MGLITGLKILVVMVIILIFFLAAYKTVKSISGGKVFGYILAEFVIFAGIAYGAQWIVTQSFIKVELKNFHNTHLLRQEKLAVKGTVHNIGKFKATEVKLQIKVINNFSGGSFAKIDDSCDATLVREFVVARNLGRGISKRFNKTFKYPSCFKLANIRAKLSYY